MYSGCEKTYRETVENSNSYNVWDRRLKEVKARRHFAESKGITIEKVSLDLVAADPMGIDGWADAIVTRQGQRNYRRMHNGSQ
jgi:hypothetical protein